jgi:hypothetical protein
VLPSSRSARDPRLRSRWRILRQRERLPWPQALFAYCYYLVSAVLKRIVF